MFKKSKKGYYFWDEFSKFNGLVHGISTRYFGSIKDKGRINEGNFKRFLDVLSIDRKSVVFPEQVHGSNVVIIDNSKKKLIQNADGLITNKKNVFLGVVTADCLPVIFYDKRLEMVGIAHAGYKGMLKGILKNMVLGFKKLRSDTKNILVAIGSSIGVCCYDVSIDRVKVFEDAFKGIKTHKIRKGKYFLDLKNIAKQTLILERIQEKNIVVSDICTKDNIKNFFSLRGEGKEKFGEFATIVGFRNTTSEVNIMSKKIHFVGIKGVGMTPLAIIAKEAGFNVTGSDIPDVFITDEALKKMRISAFKGFSESHVGDVDLVIATGAHGGFDNIEVKTAKNRGIPVVTQGEAVGLFMDGSIFEREFIGISVSGTNGKTTTTGMVATILKYAGLSPSYIIGTSFIPSLGYAGHLGKGKYFVAEADEYATDPVFDKTAKFLWQHPKIIVITNIDFDHPDIYPSIEDVKKAFKKFILKLPKNGLLVAFGDDQNVLDVITCYNGKRIIYGEGEDNDYVISNVKTNNRKTSFSVSAKDGFRSNFNLNIFGEQNVLNATASIIVGKYLGLSLDQLKKGISSYKGSKRRSEFVGRLSSGAMLFDDYAHNPTKISATLKAFRNAYPNKRIVCIFQPHTYSRTKSLFEQFVTSFDDADTVIIANIYASLREKKDPRFSSKLLADAIRRSRTVFLPNLTDVVKYIDKKNYGEDTIVITMGAGDIYQINSKLKTQNSKL